MLLNPHLIVLRQALRVGFAFIIFSFHLTTNKGSCCCCCCRCRSRDGIKLTQKMRTNSDRDAGNRERRRTTTFFLLIRREMDFDRSSPIIIVAASSQRNQFRVSITRVPQKKRRTRLVKDSFFLVSLTWKEKKG